VVLGWVLHFCLLRANKIKIMTKVFFLISLVFFNGVVMGQGKVPLRAENWEFRPGAVEFEAGGAGGSAGSGGSGTAMKIVDGRGMVMLKGMEFSDGTIEFDYLPAEQQFGLMYFRMKDSLEGECFYFRVERMGQPQAIQYAPIIDGVNCWNLFGNYQTAAEWQPNKPIHTKLVVSGRQMRVYVNNPGEPTLEVSRLEGNGTHGAIGFQGQATISNLVVRPGQVEGLSPIEGVDPTAADPRYIRHWQVTTPDSIPRVIDFAYNLMPDSQRVWKPLTAERRGLVNLTRLYGQAGSRRIVWLRTTIHSDVARSCQLRLGFLNEVWIFLNGDWVFVDKNYFGQPIAKQRGRISIDNGTLTVPLQQGDNQLLVGVGNNFYGWGIIARVEEMEGITLK
jgi:hypothetical protein